MPDSLHTENDLEVVSTHQKIGGVASLWKLPNLFLHSIFTLTGLYLLLGTFIITGVEFWGWEVSFAVGLGIAVVVIQFGLGPWLMDLSLRLMFKMEWVSPQELPEHLQRFVDAICKNKHIPFPRFGIIEDGAPQAFTYGHVPGNARIVISRGILQLLEPAEAEAVVAHELGHVLHWDMLLMTIAQLVPLIMYYLYRILSRLKGSGKGRDVAVAISIAAYVLYYVSEYVVLAFSRVREYYADRFSGEITGNPALLASALVKIAYGLAGQEKQKEEVQNRHAGLAAVSALGIYDANTALAFAIASYTPNHSINHLENVKNAMCWDLWNPWAAWYEFNSTHPLTAKRLNHLGNQSLVMGEVPYIIFDGTRPESYWDEFWMDVLFFVSPVLLPLVSWVIYKLFIYQSAGLDLSNPVLLAGLGIGLMMRYYYSYPLTDFPEMSVSSLLSQIKVSDVRPVPCTLRGTIIGRGVPGYLFSEDFVIKDETGIMFLDMRQPLRIWEMLFGIMKGGTYQGKEVIVRGWYRRSPTPYIELLTIDKNGVVQRSFVLGFKKALAFLITVFGLLWALVLI